MTLAEALATLGITPDTLTLEEKTFLDKNGYLALEDIFTDQIEAFREELAKLVAAEGEKAGQELKNTGGRVRFREDQGAVRLSDLVNKTSRFDICFTHARVLAAIAHVVGPSLKLSSLNARAALPGHGLQPLHVDWDGAVDPGDYYVCNSIWLIDDFTPENGATRVVPGSHRSGLAPEETLEDPAAAHPDQELLLGKAGTVVIFNSHTWHGGTQNVSDGPRRALHAYYCRRDQRQQLDQRAFARPETYDRLDEPARVILDI